MNTKVITATRWSVLTEVVAKLIVPITNAILARLLVPEAFGLVATINMIISFSDILTESGFGHYLINHDYQSDKEYLEHINVAFWTNFALSSIIFNVVFLFRNQLAESIGCEGYETAIVVACLAIPITSFSSIPIAILQRKLDYRSLFYNRLASSLTPLFVSTSLALLGFEYWALIIGTLASQIIKAVILLKRSLWHPSPFFSFRILKQMLSYSLWVLLEALSMWACSWIDLFIVGRYLGVFYSGLYKTAQNTVTGILSVITASINSILFSSLSRLKDTPSEFRKLYYELQEILAVIVVPMGIGMYCFRREIVIVLLGHQWMEASNFIGYWAIAMSLVATMGTFSREALRAKGMPQIAFLAQMTNLAVTIPIVYLTINQGFEILTIARSVAFLEVIIALLLCSKRHLEINPLIVVRNTAIPLLCAFFMGIFALFMKHTITNQSIILSFFEILLCMLLYTGLICCFPSKRKIVLRLFRSVILKSGLT